jgi:hypothetical protein
MHEHTSQGSLGNRCLRHLGPTLFERLRPYLLLREFFVHERPLAGQTVFPLTATFALRDPESHGELVHAGEPEEALGEWCLHGVGPSELVVRTAGTALVLLTNAASCYGGFTEELTYVRHRTVERALRWQLLVNRLTLRERVAAYLLTFGTDEVALTQQAIADALNHRREGVTETVGQLVHEGYLAHGRGRLTLLDRARLETLVALAGTSQPARRRPAHDRYSARLSPVNP